MVLNSPSITPIYSLKSEATCALETTLDIKACVVCKEEGNTSFQWFIFAFKVCVYSN